MPGYVCMHGRMGLLASWARLRLPGGAPAAALHQSPPPRGPRRRWLALVILQPLSGETVGGLGVETPIFGDFPPRATTFLVLAAFNAVLPELVVLISTTSSGRTELNAVSTKKVVV